MGWFSLSSCCGFSPAPLTHTFSAIAVDLPVNVDVDGIAICVCNRYALVDKIVPVLLILLLMFRHLLICLPFVVICLQYIGAPRNRFDVAVVCFPSCCFSFCCHSSNSDIINWKDSAKWS